MDRLPTKHVPQSLVLVMLLFVLSAPELVRAETLRCGGSSVGPGDSRLEVMKRCGEPALKDSYCAPVTATTSATKGGAPGSVTINVLPCLPVDEWLYERGPGDLPAVVRMQNGVITSIYYGRDFPPRRQP